MSDLFEDLGKILDENNMQITFTGWKAELEQAEKKIRELEEKLNFAASALSEYADPWSGLYRSDVGKARSSLAIEALAKIKGEK